MTGIPNKPTYTVTEIAFGFSVSKRTVYLWIKNNRIKTVRTPGGAIRIPRESVLPEIKENTTAEVV